MRLDDVLEQLKESNSESWSVIHTKHQMSYNDDINISILNDVNQVYLSDDLIPPFILNLAMEINAASVKNGLDSFNVSTQSSLLYYGQQCIKEFKVYKLNLNSVVYFIPEPKSQSPLQFKNRWLIRILNPVKQLKQLFSIFEERAE